jgi:ferritin-like metal-binding protein YciE
METLTDLRELLKHELKDLHSAELQLIDALPVMAETASSQDLKKSLRNHLTETREQLKRLDKIQQLLDEEDGQEHAKESKGFFANLFGSKEHCRAMEGLIKEAQQMMKEDMLPEVMDAAIIAAAQKIEHYEISSYGTAKAFALQMGMQVVAALLNETLNEEYAADDGLTALAYAGINQAAEGVDTAAALLKKHRQANAKQTMQQPKKAAVKKDNKTVAPKKAAKQTKQPARPQKAAAKKKGKSK